MSSSDLRDRMDGLEANIRTETNTTTTYPESLSRHSRTLEGTGREVAYPESLSRYNRSLGLANNQIDCSPHMYKRTVKKKVDRRGRFRTQPVTFSEIKEVDEEKLENPLTGLSDNSSDFSDNEKSSSMTDLRMRWSGGLGRSYSGRRRLSGGSRSNLDIAEVAREEGPSSPEEQEEATNLLQRVSLDMEASVM